MQEYVVREGSLHERFLKMRTPIQVLGGAFGNGKSTSLIIKTIEIVRDYPGCRVLMCRATEKKLKATLQKDFFDWLPKSWIKHYNKEDKELTLKNGSTILFRYLAQKSDAEGNSTSNVLSGSFDLIVVDQMEDPEITHKDFLDLIGRMRGKAIYRGNDETMPRKGLGWMLLACNPTRNWVYRKLVRPYHLWQQGKSSPDLLLDTETGMPIISVEEGSTYDNKENLPEGYIKRMEIAYQGQMRDRFLLGLWSAYEGLVYPMWDTNVHMIRHELMLEHLDYLRGRTMHIPWIEGFDYGIAKPSCYLCAYTDAVGNIFILDGFYGAELSNNIIRNNVFMIRNEYKIDPTKTTCWSDPQLFRRTTGANNANVVGTTVVGELKLGNMARGNNAVSNGIMKVREYLQSHPQNIHPFTAKPNAPFIYVSEKLEFFDSEISDYMWKKNKSLDDDVTEEPVKKNDHAMDTLKYMLGARPRVAELINDITQLPEWTKWHTVIANSNNESSRNHRYG